MSEKVEAFGCEASEIERSQVNGFNFFNGGRLEERSSSDG
jgi:hypothetical protein